MGECATTKRLDDDADTLSPEEQLLLLQTARRALECHVARKPLPPLLDHDIGPRLREKRAAFVTLRVQHDLRGCVGYPVHRAPLIRTVQENAINAASRDPRFAPVTADELPGITIEISVLSRGDTPDRPFIRLTSPNEIILGRDGLFIEHGRGCTGLLLPQVPIEHHWGLPQFLEGICLKAGLPNNAWENPDTILYRFSAEVFSERP